MSSDFLRFSALALFLNLLAGCGGSPSSGSGSTGGNSGGQTDSTTITYTFTGAAPTAVAVKIGTGDFLPATITNSELSFTLPDGTTDFAVAYACPGFSPFLGSGSTQNFEYLNFSSSLDTTTFNGGCTNNLTSGPSGGTTPTAALTGSVNSGSFPGASELFVWTLTPSFNTGQSFNLPLNSAFSMSSAQPGSDEVVLSLFDSSWNALAVKSVGDQTAPGTVNNGSPVDFVAGDATTFQPVTYVNLPTGYSTLSTSVSVDSRELNALLAMNGSLGPNVSSQKPLTQYSLLPATLGQSGDQYVIESTALMQLSSATSVVTFSQTTGGGPATVTFLAPWPYAGPTPAALPAFNFSYTGSTGQSELLYSGNLQWSPTPGLDDLISISLTPNYQSASRVVAVPDLSAIPGFIAAPATGTRVLWSAQISTAPLLPGSGSTDLTTSSASNSGTYTVP